MFKTMHPHSTVLPKLTTEKVLQLEFNSKLHRSQSSSFASAHDDYYTACCVLCISRVILTHADDDCNSARMRNRWVGEACLSWEGQSTLVSLTNELYFGLPRASVLLCCQNKQTLIHTKNNLKSYVFMCRDCYMLCLHNKRELEWVPYIKKT